MHTISFVGLASSHDLVETVVFVVLTRNIGICSVLRGGLFTKRIIIGSRGFRGSCGLGWYIMACESCYVANFPYAESTCRTWEFLLSFDLERTCQGRLMWAPGSFGPFPSLTC